MSGAIHQRLGWSTNCPLQMAPRGEATKSPSSCKEHCRVVVRICSSTLSTSQVQCVECGEGGFPAGPKCGWFYVVMILSPSKTSNDSTTQFIILPGRQSRTSKANVIQVRHKVTLLKMSLKRKGKVKDEKKKR